MADSSIEWTQKVWNPCVGCNKVSEGCKFCYAEIMHRRLMKIRPEKYSRPFLDGAFEYEPALPIPFGWKKPVMVFPTSMSDLFHKNISVEFIAKVYATMFLTPRHTYQMLTKRPERRLEVFGSAEFFNFLVTYINEYQEKYVQPTVRPYAKLTPYRLHEIMQLFPFRNIWEGTSTEDQPRADERIPILLQTPAAIRWISAEPLVGPIDLKLFRGEVLNHKLDNLAAGRGKSKGLDWVVVGGESGRKDVQPVHPDWIRSLRDQCQVGEIAFFFKQWGEYSKDCAGAPTHTKAVCVGIDGKYIHYPAKGNEVDLLSRGITMYKNGKHASGRLLDGREWNEFPKAA